MPKGHIAISLILPNGRRRQFILPAKKDWIDDLKQKVMKAYPASSEVYFVDALPGKGLRSGQSFETNVMFKLRQNYYRHGHLRASDAAVDSESA